MFASFGERLELGTVILLLLVAGSAWGFIELADAVVEGETLAIDRALLLAMRSPADPADPLGPGWLVEMGRDVTALGGVAVLVLVTLAVTVFMVLRRLWHAAGLLLAAVGSGIIVSTLLKNAFERARPDLVPHGSYVATASFPSGHSMMAAVVYLTLGALLARVEPDGRVKVFVLCCAVLLTLLVGISRVYLGVHWPTDVLAGWTVGAGWALLFWLMARALQRRGRIETDTGG
ncbi:phosphatase PAP2 family protein [Roseomonas sp. ROY-5-3]|uniref:Phosphatase PAP2 family protein n=2 Tax=Acetobacterales TaxID=3120395 RepID=A0ABS6H2K2_9PROT|nr:phosphatase PAP2 family protein [Roseomonas oleicola]